MPTGTYSGTSPSMAIAGTLYIPFNNGTQSNTDTISWNVSVSLSETSYYPSPTILSNVYTTSATGTTFYISQVNSGFQAGANRITINFTLAPGYYRTPTATPITLSNVSITNNSGGLTYGYPTITFQ